MAAVKLLIKLRIYQRKQLLIGSLSVLKINSTMLVCILLQIKHNMLRACHKLSRINEVYVLNLGLKKIKKETTAPQMISFHRTP